VADERLRALLRRAQQTGDPGDRARAVQTALREGALAEAIRAGVLSRERAALAAYLGDARAAEACGEPVAPVPTEPPEPARYPAYPGGPELFTGPPPEGTPLEAWADGLERWGQEAMVRVAVVAARRVLRLWDWDQRTSNPYPQDVSGDAPPGDRPALALEAAEAWLREPTPARAAVHDALEGTFYTWVMDAGLAAAHAAWIDPEPEHPPSRPPVGACVKAAAEAEVAWRIYGGDEPRSGPKPEWGWVYLEVDRWLRAALAEALVPWALGLTVDADAGER
jgi:hypothetical protein